MSSARLRLEDYFDLVERNKEAARRGPPLILREKAEPESDGAARHGVVHGDEIPVASRAPIRFLPCGPAKVALPATEARREAGSRMRRPEQHIDVEEVPVEVGRTSGDAPPSRRTRRVRAPISIASEFVGFDVQLCRRQGDA